MNCPRCNGTATHIARTSTGLHPHVCLHCGQVLNSYASRGEAQAYQAKHGTLMTIESCASGWEVEKGGE